MLSQKEKRDFKNSVFNAATDLAGAHHGEPAFVIGNGKSVEFYDTDRMAECGVMIGCNLGFQKHKLDYLCWQDTKIAMACGAWPGNKVTSLKHCKKRGGPNIVEGPIPKNWYCFNYGRFLPHGFSKINTGGLAFQLAVLMECDPIFLVGIDGCFVKGLDGADYSNVFQDKAKTKTDRISKRGKSTTAHLWAHINSIEKLMDRYKKHCNVYQMGDWGIMNACHVDFPYFYGSGHPKKGNN